MIELILFPALVVFFLDYCFGQPSKDWSPTAIFSNWVFFLSKIRLKQLRIWDDIKFQKVPASNKYDDKLASQHFKKLVVSNTSKVQGWLKPFGLCPICFHFWVASTFYFFLSERIEIISFVITIGMSHLLIRFLIKYI